MQNVAIEILLDYIFNFAIIWIISFAGCFSRDGYDTIKNNTNINFKRVFIVPIFITMVLSVLFSYLSCPFALMIFISYLGGWFGTVIIECFLDVNKVKIFVKNIFKNISNPITKGIADSMKEIKEEEQKAKNDKESKPDG